MCGVTGFWNFKATASKEQLLNIVRNMGLLIKERGPDSAGEWCDETIGLSFGHRRLAVVDLTVLGHQPMLSKSKKSVISYNGEIFNARELREKLIKEGCEFRGNSDTEVILEACEKWGVSVACEQFIGMFAFSFWDKKNRELYLVRDRLGIKPLYWGFNQEVLFFGSQLKSFIAYPLWNPELSKEALASYFRFNYVPAPLSIYKNIYKLLPGTIIKVDNNKNVKEERFWDLKKIPEKSKENSSKTIQSWINECEVLLKDAVSRRMIADVPLGAFLSGGIDSSTVVALMQAQSSHPVKTFSIGFQEEEYNEAKYASKIARYLKTDHYELYLSSDDARGIIPIIPNFYDEPFADVSQIPTYLVSQLARQHVTVSLSGDGGDELFAGYNRYIFGQKIWKKIRFLPSRIRYALAHGISSVSPNYWEKFSQLIPSRYRPELIADKAYKFSEMLMANNPYEFYKMLVSFWNNPQDLVIASSESNNLLWNNARNMFQQHDFISAMQMMDTLTYLPDDILTKVDRASMAVSLEVRVPLLDHRVVEFASQLPMQLKIREGKSKWLLRQVLYKYIPKEMMERPKMGFGVPIGSWLRGSLRDWSEELLSVSRIKQEGILNPALIRQRWEEHLSGKRNWQYSLWGVLMFQAWKETWMK